MATMMMTRGASRAARSVITAVGPRYFSVMPAANSTATALSKVLAASNNVRGVGFGSFPVRYKSTTAAAVSDVVENEERHAETAADGGSDGGEKRIASYWGVEPKKVTKDDGTEWKWSCFMPWETYQADLSIDLGKHHKPKNFLDKLAYWTVKSFVFPLMYFFRGDMVAVL